MANGILCSTLLQYEGALYPLGYPSRLSPICSRDPCETGVSSAPKSMLPCFARLDFLVFIDLTFVFLKNTFHRVSTVVVHTHKCNLLNMNALCLYLVYWREAEPCGKTAKRHISRYQRKLSVKLRYFIRSKTKDRYPMCMYTVPPKVR